MRIIEHRIFLCQINWNYNKAMELIFPIQIINILLMY